MTNSTMTAHHPIGTETEVWESLQQAIAECSGFQQWQAQQNKDADVESLDEQVRSYLRETLETLAY
ncbi:conserved hypothetical protein [Crocosphaera subtropica ATCC 51142]|uniref:Uncharacterized protein n=1 Tax=Crocosphaera subtropica (strain ATCC 51142 / BH68) TaxID=43989 RepID=B1WUA0_CROS5|nr:hypothetical protein [Crocosphaera subtropica]ACB52162.1 conserved hypothetical protein [Crocosphaera subtropica ATCC 51142]